MCRMRDLGPFILIAFLVLGAWGQYNTQQPQPYEQALLIEVNESLSVERVHQNEFRDWLKKYVQRKSGKTVVAARSCVEFWAVPREFMGTAKLQPLISGRDHVFLDYSPLPNGKSILAITTK